MIVRDGGLSFSSLVYHVCEGRQSPNSAVLLDFFFDSKLCCTVFTAITAPTTFGYQISYVKPVFL